MSYFLNTIRAELNAIKVAGGWKASFYRVLRETNLRTGTLIGTDKYGNKYFENNSYFMATLRCLSLCGSLHLWWQPDSCRMASLVALHDGWPSHQSTSRTSKVHTTTRDKQNRHQAGVCSLQHHSTKDRRMATSKEQLMNSINSQLILASCKICTDYIRFVVQIMCQGMSIIRGRTLPVCGTEFLKFWLKWNIENCRLLFGQWVLDKYFWIEYWKRWLISC